MLNLIGDAGAYLSAPAERSRWQDTWTMRRTRREAMTALARAYASWVRTVGGVVSTVLLLGGAFLLGRGVTALSSDGGLVAVLTLIGAVLLFLVGLAAAGYLLFTGTQLVGALRAWSGARGQDGGPGVAVVRTPALVVRLVLALVAFAAGIALVLVSVGILTIDLGWVSSEGGEAAGQELWQWFAAVIAAAAGLAAGSGAIRAGLAVRRRPQRPGAVPEAAAAPQQAAAPPQSGMATQGGWATQGGYGQPTAAGAAHYNPQTDDTWQAGYAPQAEPAAPTAAAAAQYTPHTDDTWQAGYAPQGAQDQWAGQDMQSGSPHSAAAAPEQPAPQSPYVPQSPYAPQGPYVPQSDHVPTAPQQEEEWAATRKVSDLPAAAPPSPALRAVLPDGRTISDDGVTLLGRSPASRTDEQIAEAVAVADAGVSKTHVAVRLDTGRAWATDRASTNGTIVVRDGRQEPLTPWQEMPLAAGDHLVLGSTTVRIETAESR